ncbi:MAG: Hsp20/alpha crystallin family protein [Verrucomicrobia bacterium]|nr:Hsp20/alpha crystallin family protein [Verrucomicrobiota bacterium]
MAQLFEDFLPATNSSNLVTDLHEDTDHFHARFELPGVKKDAVKIELHERVLTVTAERVVKAGEKELSRTFTRSLALPEIVQEDGITAKLEDGILSVTLPKQESRKPKVISVN